MDVLHVFSLGVIGLGFELVACGGKETSPIDLAPHDASVPEAGPDVPPSPIDVWSPPPETGPGSSACAALLDGIDGAYYASCLPKDLPAPFAFAVQQMLQPSPGSPAGTLDMTLTPLKINAITMTDTVGSIIVAPRSTLGADCTFTLNIGTLTLPAEANSLGRDLVATDVVLRGKLQSHERSCAELDGVVPLIMLSLKNDGDVCAFIRVSAPGSLPQVDDYACPPSILPPR